MFDSINLFLSAIRNEKIDSLFDGHCQDCGVYIFMISYPDTIMESMIIGTKDINNNLTKLARFLLKKKPDAANRIDTCAEFKTTKYLKPPPPPQPIKYR